MEKENNANCSADLQIIHDNMVRYIANDLASRGYSVLADHIGWPKGAPGMISGYVPDITITNIDSFIIFEIKTCENFSDELTREQLTVFDNKGGTYIIIPPACSRDNQAYDPVAEAKQNLKNWGLFLVRVGTCDPYTGIINYYA